MEGTVDKPSLPNTHVQLCEHPEHLKSGEARATSLIRFAQSGQVQEFHSCLAHATAVQFGYQPAATDAETLAKLSKAASPKETDSEDRPGEAIVDGSGVEHGAERGRDEPDEAAASRELDAAREEIAAEPDVDGLECRPISEDDDFVDGVECGPTEPEEPPNQSVGDLDVETGADDEL